MYYNKTLTHHTYMFIQIFVMIRIHWQYILLAPRRVLIIPIWLVMIYEPYINTWSHSVCRTLISVINLPLSVYITHSGRPALEYTRPHQHWNVYVRLRVKHTSEKSHKNKKNISVKWICMFYCFNTRTKVNNTKIKVA